MNLSTSIVIFITYFITDMLYANFVKYVSGGYAVKAATCSATISLLMTFGILKCIDNQWYLIPLITGAWLGTYVAIKLN